MEINKKLFEDVLSGKLKGTFVLRNGEKCSSTDLHLNYNKFKVTNPYALGIKSYTPKGLYCEGITCMFDIIDFMSTYKTIDLEILEYCRKNFEFMQILSKAIENMNTLEIEIPEGKEIDWNESKKENKIVLKDKQLTYGEVCRKLFGNQDHYIIERDGSIEVAALYRCACEPNAAEDMHQLECILAKNMLANTAKYLNGGWKPDKGEYVFTITYRGNFDNKPVVGEFYFGCGENLIVFKTLKSAQQAIEILGEKTVKLALEPLGI